MGINQETKISLHEVKISLQIHTFLTNLPTSRKLTLAGLNPRDVIKIIILFVCTNHVTLYSFYFVKNSFLIYCRRGAERSEGNTDPTDYLIPLLVHHLYNLFAAAEFCELTNFHTLIFFLKNTTCSSRGPLITENNVSKQTKYLITNILIHLMRLYIEQDY